MNIKQIKNELENIEVTKLELLSQLKVARGKQKFRCVCGELHQISKCDLLYNPTWISGSGYEDGYYNNDNTYVSCPTHAVLNRLLFPSFFRVEYELRQQIEHNAFKQFMSTYKASFTRYVDINETEYKTTRWLNTNYFDENHEKFEISI